jgi:hypothetical protein
VAEELSVSFVRPGNVPAKALPEVDFFSGFGPQAKVIKLSPSSHVIALAVINRLESMNSAQAKVFVGNRAVEVQWSFM